METTDSSFNFKVNIPSAAKTLAKFVGTDKFWEQYLNVVLLPDRGIITATERHILQVVSVEPQGDFAPGLIVAINPKHIAKIAGKEVNITVTQTEKLQRVEIACDGEIYTTENKRFYCYPDVLRAIPRDADRYIITLAPESLVSLKKLCKVIPKHITISLTQGSSTMLVTADPDYTAPTAVALKLAKPSEVTAKFNFEPRLLAATLDGCNGAFGVKNSDHSVKVYGDADATVIWAKANKIEDCAQRLTDFCASKSTFAEDVAEVVNALRSAAQRFWQYVVKCYGGRGLELGNYTASEIARCKPCKGMILPTHGTEFEKRLTVSAGNIRMEISYRHIFVVLARWEKLVRGNATFSVGQTEEVTATVLEPNENKVVERKLKLRKLGDGWYTTARREAKDWDAPIYFEINGHFIYVRHLSAGMIDDTEAFAAWTDGKVEEIPGIIIKNAITDDYFAELVEKIGIATGAKQISPKKEHPTPKKIQEITTEREFISKLRAYYRAGRRKGYTRSGVSFLGLMEHSGASTPEYDYFSKKYFSLAPRAYDWVHGNSLASALIDKWEKEIEAEMRKKPPVVAS